MFELLRSRYPAPAWALFPQVSAHVSYGQPAADALAVSLWPSKGVQIHGFEFRSSRSDWLRELKQPDKAGPVARYCTHWWLVTPTLSISREGELPDQWGWLCGEKPSRPAREQTVIERQVHKDQLAFAWDGWDGAAEAAFPDITAPLPPVLDLRSRVLWTVRPAGRRHDQAPTWSFLAAVPRRAHAAVWRGEEAVRA